MTLLSAEFLKLRTTRVPYVLLGVVAILSGVAVAGLVGAGTIDERERALDLAGAANLSATFAIVLGILLVTNEYRHGTIASTFLVEPNRFRVAATKIAAALVAGAVYGVAAVAAAAAVALPWLAAQGAPLALDGEALDAAGRVVLSFALSTAFGAAVGAILHNQVGAIVATFIWFLVVEPIVALVAGLAEGDLGAQAEISKYLPGAAFDAIVAGIGEPALRAGPAILLAAAYVVVLGVLGALSMSRRDP